MKRLALGVALILTVSGCAAVKGYFTEPTGVITIERQDFLDTWALVTVLAEERRRAYDRVRLSAYFEGASADDLTLAPAGVHRGRKGDVALRERGCGCDREQDGGQRE